MRGHTALGGAPACLLCSFLVGGGGSKWCVDDTLNLGPEERKGKERKEKRRAHKVRRAV